MTSALGGISIDEDGLSDEYDFMDDDDETGERRRQAKQQGPQYKYKQRLQDLADRKTDEITVDLDDVAAWEEQVGDDGLHLLDSVLLNTKHYVDVVSKAVDNAMPAPSSDVR